MIRALKTELEVIFEWVGDGYKQLTLEEYKRKADAELPDHWLRTWYSPSRIIFSFPYATIKNVISHPHLHELPDDVVRALALLDHSITGFLDSYHALRDFVAEHPELAFKVDWKLRNGVKDFTNEERMFKEEVFRRNYGLHIKRIGCADSPESEHCLYRTYHSAKQSLEALDEWIRPTLTPALFRAGDILATVLFLLGLLVAVFVIKKIIVEGGSIMLWRFVDAWIVLAILGVWSWAWWRAQNPLSLHLESTRSAIEAGLSFVSIALPLVVGAMLLTFQSDANPLPERVVRNMLVATYWFIGSATLAILNLSRLPSMPLKNDRIEDRLTPVLGIAQFICLLAGSGRMVVGIRVLWIS